MCELPNWEPRSESDLSTLVGPYEFQKNLEPLKYVGLTKLAWLISNIECCKHAWTRRSARVIVTAGAFKRRGPPRGL